MCTTWGSLQIVGRNIICCPQWDSLVLIESRSISGVRALDLMKEHLVIGSGAYLCTNSLRIKFNVRVVRSAREYIIRRFEQS